MGGVETHQPSLHSSISALSDIVNKLVLAESPTELAESVIQYLNDEFGLVSGYWRQTADRSGLPLLSEVSKVTGETSDKWKPPGSIPAECFYNQFQQDGLAVYDDDVLVYSTDQLSVTDTRPQTQFHREFQIITPHSLVIGGKEPESREGWSQHSEAVDCILLDILQGIISGADERIQREQSYQVSNDVYNRILRHNVRNRLTIIQGAAETIEMDIEEMLNDSDPPHEVMDNLKKIRGASNQLERSVENVLSIDEIVRNPYARTETNLVDVLSNQCATFSSRYSVSVQCIIEPTEAQFRCHKKFYRAVEELVENAVIHNDDPEVTVKLESTDRSYRVTVTDTGRGIPDAELAAIRSGKETQMIHGTGTGLWLADQLVRLSGGTLSFETSEEGTEAIITLPKDTPKSDTRFQV